MTTETSPYPSPAARREAVTQHLLVVGSAHPQELADRFGVSLVTMHRDLDKLAAQGLVRKFHGGVTALPSTVFESNVTYRRRQALAEKRAIARCAAELIEPGMVVLFDESTTHLPLVEKIADVEPLTVITNFQPVISLLLGRPNIQLIALGGEYNAAHDSFIGPPCIASASAVHADLGFYSVAGIAHGQTYHQEQLIVLTKQALIETAHRRVLLADHSKLGRTALHRVVHVDEFDLLISDAAADERELTDIRERGVTVRVAEERALSDRPGRTAGRTGE